MESSQLSELDNYIKVHVPFIMSRSNRNALIELYESEANVQKYKSRGRVSICTGGVCVLTGKLLIDSALLAKVLYISGGVFIGGGFVALYYAYKALNDGERSYQPEMERNHKIPKTKKEMCTVIEG